MKDPFWDYAAQVPWNQREDASARVCDGGAPCRHCHVVPVYLMADEHLVKREPVARLCLHCGEGTPDRKWIEEGWDVG